MQNINYADKHIIVSTCIQHCYITLYLNIQLLVIIIKIFSDIHVTDIGIQIFRTHIKSTILIFRRITHASEGKLYVCEIINITLVKTTYNYIKVNLKMKHKSTRQKKLILYFILYLVLRQQIRFDDFSNPIIVMQILNIFKKML